MGRLARYAAYSVLQLAVVVAVVAGVVPAEVGGLAVLVASIPVAFGWGHVQADVALNPAFDDRARSRWRVGVWCVPGAVALYWLLHVRPRRAALD